MKRKQNKTRANNNVMTRLYPYNKLPITAIAEVKNIDKKFH